VKPIHLVIGFVMATFNATQSRVNGALGHFVGSAITAALVSFGSGLVVVTLIVLSVPRFRAAFQSIPELVRSGELKWWQCIGGISGAFYVIGQGFIVPIIGVAIFTIAIVAGQTVSSLFVDKFGLGPAGPRAVSMWRIFSAALAIVGVVVSVMGRDHTGTFSLPAIMYAFGSGSLTAAQYAVNGRVAKSTQQPLASTLLNFLVGTSTLIVVMIIDVIATHKMIPPPPSPLDHPILWTGGTIGVVYIAAAAVLVRLLGVLIFALTTVVGQLTGAVILDIAFPTSGSHVTTELMLGVAITAGAVILASFTPQRNAPKVTQ